MNRHHSLCYSCEWFGRFLLASHLWYVRPLWLWQLADYNPLAVLVQSLLADHINHYNHHLMQLIQPDSDCLGPVWHYSIEELVLAYCPHHNLHCPQLPALLGCVVAVVVVGAPMAMRFGCVFCLSVHMLIVTRQYIAAEVKTSIAKKNTKQHCENV